jgi:hypothetical protein
VGELYVCQDCVSVRGDLNILRDRKAKDKVAERVV